MARKRIVCIKRSPKHEDPYRHISQVGIGGGAGFSEVLLVEEVTQQLQSPTGDGSTCTAAMGGKPQVKLGPRRACTLSPAPWASWPSA